jgi:hypothetical protein
MADPILPYTNVVHHTFSNPLLNRSRECFSPNAPISQQPLSCFYTMAWHHNNPQYQLEPGRRRRIYSTFLGISVVGKKDFPSQPVHSPDPWWITIRFTYLNFFHLSSRAVSSTANDSIGLVDREKAGSMGSPGWHFSFGGIQLVGHLDPVGSSPGRAERW